jgi:ubiquinone/menaquinone biosynthesis C-methylase UbiE
MPPRSSRRAASPDTGRVRDVFDRQARHYDAVIAVAERLLFRGGRDWACRQVSGRVLEVGIGTGRNLPLYPPETELTGIELSPAMLDQARARAAQLGRPADLRVGDAQKLPFPDAGFDSVIATLTLCSIPDADRAVAEMARVLRPGGRLVLLDHVASPLPGVRRVQRLLEPAFLRLAADHLLREPEVAVRASGLEIEELTRSKLGIVLRLSCRKR